MAVKTVIIGLGNPILSDDGVGIFTAREIKEKLPPGAPVDVKEASLAGFNLLDLMLGYDKAIIIDSIQTRDGKVGEIYEFSPDALKETIRLVSIHDMNLATSLDFARMLKMPAPETVTIYAVEVEDNTTFKEGCSDKVADAIPIIVDKVLHHLNNCCQAP